MDVHKIAVIPGDGVGPDVIREGVRVLEEAARLDGLNLPGFPGDAGIT
ncbi:MAG: hypothetical protein ACLRMW_04885 [[Clostridium] symbiosum]